MRRLIDEVVSDYDERAALHAAAAARLPLDSPRGLRRGGRLRAAAAAPDDESVEEIWINGRLSHGSRSKR